MKAGEIHEHKEIKISSATSPKAISGGNDKPEQDKALADLGIEFSPPEKIENISFNNPRNPAQNYIERKPEHHRPEHHNRKEINLSELKKALEESLSEKEPEKKSASESSLRGPALGGDEAISPSPKALAEQGQSGKKDKKDNNKKTLEPGKPVRL